MYGYCAAEWCKIFIGFVTWLSVACHLGVALTGLKHDLSRAFNSTKARITWLASDKANNSLFIASCNEK